MRALIVTCLLIALAAARPAGAGPHEDADLAYARGDYASALQIYRELAAQGLAPAQFNLGVMHDFGQGTERDPVAAAVQGHGGAQFNLGGMYFEGLGVPQDNLRAYLWFTLGAIAGAPGASRNRTSVGKLLSPDELARAQQMARECQVRKYSGCD